MRPLFILATLFALSSTAAADDSRITADLVANTTAIQPGHPFTVGIHLHIADAMHVYWLNPGDGGGPVRVTWHLPDGFTAGDLQFPVPDRISEPGGLMIYGYENDVLLQATITPPASLFGMTAVPLYATINYVVCNTDQCYFGQTDVNPTLPIATSPSDSKPDNAALFAAWQPRMPRQSSDAFSSVDVTQNKNAAANTAELKFHWKDPATAPSDIHWLPFPSDELTVHEQSVTTDGPTTTLTLSIQPTQGIPQKQATISGLLSYHEGDHPPRGVLVTLDRNTLRLTESAPK